MLMPIFSDCINFSSFTPGYARVSVFGHLLTLMNFKANFIFIIGKGGTLTMAPDPQQGGALAPVEGALSNYMKDMDE